MQALSRQAPHPVTVRRHRLSFDLAREFALAFGAFLIYFGVRGLTESNFDRAVANAHHLIAFEERLHVFIEDDVQDLIEGSAFLVNVANWVYIWGHWPVITVVAAWLITARPAKYRIVRNAFLISGAVGLIVFAAFPVAPPRLLDIGLVDTVTDRSHAYRVLQPKAFVNQYAAMPSLHFGWDLIIGIALAVYATPVIVKAVGAVLPLLMAFAVVATANHFVIDAVAGGALALAGLGAALLLERRLPPIGVRPDRGTRALPEPGGPCG